MKFAPVLFIIFVVGCTNSQNAPKKITISASWLDSIKSKSDTHYIRHYRNTDFVKAEYFVNRKDTTICQVMKDSSGNIRQVIVAKENRKLFFAEYYKNGQLISFLPVGPDGKYNGIATYYYENGTVKNTGLYSEGFRAGKWTNYNEDGHLVSTDVYSSSGELEKTIK